MNLKKQILPLLIFAILQTVNLAKSDKFVIQNWGMDEGLPTNRVIKIESDQNGFLWLATDNGLVRFDGFKFTTYNSLNSKLISDNLITNVFTNLKKEICFTVSKNHLNTSKNYLVKQSNGIFEAIYSKDGLAQNLVLKNAIKSENKLWMLTHENIYSLEENNFIIHKNFYGIPSSKISQFAMDSYGALWIAVKSEGIYKYNNGNFVKYFQEYNIENRVVRKMFFDSQNRMWIGTKNEIISFEIGTQKRILIFKEFSNKLLRDLAEDKQGNVWLATSRNGLFLLTINNELINITKQSGLSDDSITSLKIIDNNIWVSTLNGGLNHINRPKLKTIDKKCGLTSQYVNSFFCDEDNSILIGTNKGIFKINDLNTFEEVEKLNFLKDKHIYAINRDKNGNLLVGTRLFGMYIISRKGGVSNNFSSELKRNFVRAIFVDDDNTIYVGTNTGGVTVISSNGVANITRKDGLSNELIAFIHKAKNGEIWVGTSGGGVNILLNNKVIKVIDISSGLKGNIISSIYEDELGTIWLSINGGGLAKISNGKISNFTTDDGLYSNKLLNIACDKNNLFWFTTPHGIFSVKKTDVEDYSNGKLSSISYDLYGKTDGMPIERCTGSSPQTAIISNDGTLFAATSKGAVVLNTNTITPVGNSTNLIIDKIRVNDEIINPKNYMKLSPNPQKVEFSFSAINFNTPRYVKLYYKLNGIDSDWRKALQSRSVSYSYLPYGKYTFEIKTNIVDENEKAEHAKISINILPQFWEILWVQIIVFLIFLLIVVVTTKYINTLKFKRKLKLLELEKVLEKERIRISKDMHDEVGANLTKMSLLSEIAKKNIDNKKELENYLNQITNTGVEVASSLDELVWTVNPKNDKLDRMIFYIVKFAEDFLSSTDIILNFSIPDNIPEKHLSAEIRHNIFSVIKEAINNSIKHSKCSEINLSFLLEGKRLKIIINDNGIGCDFKSIDNFSNGLNNMKSRIESLDGSIVFSNREPKGVEILVVVEI